MKKENKKEIALGLMLNSSIAVYLKYIKNLSVAPH